MERPAARKKWRADDVSAPSLEDRDARTGKVRKRKRIEPAGVFSRTNPALLRDLPDVLFRRSAQRRGCMRGAITTASRTCYNRQADARRGASTMTIINSQLHAHEVNATKRPGTVRRTGPITSRAMRRWIRPASMARSSSPRLARKTIGKSGAPWPVSVSQRPSRSDRRGVWKLPFIRPAWRSCANHETHHSKT